MIADHALKFLFHDCTLLDRTSVSNHDMYFKWKNTTKGTLSESQQKRITAHIRGNQFAESWMEQRESFNGSTGRLVTGRSQEAEKAGLLISKKWIDAGKPKPLAG